MNLPIFMSNTQVITNGVMGADINSTALDVSEARVISAQLNWSGTAPVGNAYIQGSHDGTNWASVTAGAAVSGNTGSLIINYPDPGFRYARILYDNTSGVGTAQGYLSQKR